MIKDSFDVLDCEPTVNQTWVTLLAQENSNSKNTTAFSTKVKTTDSDEETIFINDSMWQDRTEVNQLEQKREETRTYSHLFTPQLLIYEESNKIPRKVVLETGKISVGRGKNNQIVVHDPLLSRCHFILDVRESLVDLTDLSSENGTKVNGVRVEKCQLIDNDKIEIGKTVIYYTVQDIQDLDASFKQNNPHVLNENSIFRKEVAKVHPKAGGLLSLFSSKKELDVVSTVGVIIFFIIATGCLVLGGAAIGTIFHQESVIRSRVFNEKIISIIHLVAWGDLNAAELMLNRAREEFSNKEELQQVFIVESVFIKNLHKFKAAERLASLGNFEQAAATISEIDLNQMSQIEKNTVKSLLDKKNNLWQSYSAKIKSPQVKKAQVNRKISTEEQWLMAVNLYKKNKKKESCNLIKKIALQKDALFSQKAKSFFDRRCAL